MSNFLFKIIHVDAWHGEIRSMVIIADNEAKALATHPLHESNPTYKYSSEHDGWIDNDFPKSAINHDWGAPKELTIEHLGAIDTHLPTPHVVDYTYNIDSIKSMF